MGGVKREAGVMVHYMSEQFSTEGLFSTGLFLGVLIAFGIE